VGFSQQLTQTSDEEIEVMMALAAAVLEHEEVILSASELFGELDSLLALALAAEKYNWAAPTVTTSNVIDIVAGRHPLQELLVPSYIPNDCALAGGCGTGGLYEGSTSVADATRGSAPSMLILTGPNNSGKSVYMKQIALIVYLAHTGSYVPATRATIGVTDRILTRIATRETAANDESAFLVDLKQAAFAMNFATRRSLLLVDEFGKGTTAECGSALLTAYLTFFLDLGMERPKVLAGTHFHEVFENGFLPPGKDVGFAHMDVHLDPDAKDPEEQITFLYRLLPGRGLSSLGVLCAAANDIPSDVIRRAEAIVALQDRNESLVETCSELSEEEKRELERAELIARRFLAWQIPSPGRGEGDGPTIREMLQAVLGMGEMGTPQSCWLF
jgi:DNA mismatch repair protein MSH5